jgi:hypothetical protein
MKYKEMTMMIFEKKEKTSLGMKSEIEEPATQQTNERTKALTFF